MADNITILNSASTVITLRTRDNGASVQIPTSVPTNPSGTALLGQATMATSIPVVIASDQSTLTTVIAAGVAAIGTVSALQSGAWSIAAAGGTVSLGGGTATIALSAGAAAIGTATVLLTQVGGKAVTLGSTTGASSIPVVIASDQAIFTVAVSNSLTVSSNTTTPLAVASVSGAVAGIAIKATAGQLVGVNVFNTNTSYPVFLKVFNLSASVVTAGGINAGAAIPTFVAGISPGSCRDVALPLGTNFTTAMSYAITKFAIANDTTAVTTNDLVGMITWF